ncbi:EamA-like transporter family [Bifidobacterium lemurum]|uniref:EamA-like transporter family n=1 Tax=Bifidobacterium lemurum TaxID=1603886 RepID=A0A261FWA4_9BIFI|nr:DMT family transporter [Bifidobacterium lemurum]OZG63432.1 EamA-like transporter family [Bifidobacterium lemurum]QOL35538.1 DMT family transporter [Bifidobacterium lemurum]
MLCLLLTAIIWGFSFVSQVSSMDAVSPLFFNATRFTLGACSLVPVIALMRRGEGADTADRADSPAERRSRRQRTVATGMLCGVLLFAAGTLQQYGILWGRSAGRAGFITALYIVLVPLFGLFLHRRVTALTGVSVIIALVGFYLLCVADGFDAINKGDLTVFLGAVMFAAHILAIDTLGAKVEPIRMSFVQFATTAALSWAGAAIEGSVDWTGAASSWVAILYAGIASVGVAYTLQAVGQRQVPPTRSAVILSLESLFSAAGGALLLGETMTARGYAGCALIFLGTILAQLPAKVPDALRRPDRRTMR